MAEVKINLRRRILAIGSRDGEESFVRCQGCGEKIYSNQITSDIEYVKTKRGTELFFDRACLDKVWYHGIC